MVQKYRDFKTKRQFSKFRISAYLCRTVLQQFYDDIFANQILNCYAKKRKDILPLRLFPEKPARCAVGAAI